MEVGERLICISQSVLPSFYFGRKISFSSSDNVWRWRRGSLHQPQRKNGTYLLQGGIVCGEGRALLHHPCLPLPWVEVGEGLILSTVCLPLPWVEVGEGLIYIIHSVSPSTLGGGGGGEHLYHPQCVSLYLGWRLGRGSFTSSTVWTFLLE